MIGQEIDSDKLIELRFPDNRKGVGWGSKFPKKNKKIK